MAAPWPGLLTATLFSGLGALLLGLLALAAPVRNFARGRLPKAGEGAQSSDAPSGCVRQSIHE